MKTRFFSFVGCLLVSASVLQGCVSDELNAQCIQEAQATLKKAYPLQSSIVHKGESPGCHVFHSISLLDAMGKEIVMDECCDSQPTLVLTF